MSALVLGVIESAERGWGSGLVLGSVALGLVLLAMLVAAEARATHPIMPLRLFGDRRRAAAYGARALYLGAMIGFFFFTTQLLQEVFGLSAVQAGVAFFPMTVVNFAVALAVPRLGARVGSAVLLTAGVALTLLGMAWLSHVDPASTYLAGVALPMVLVGAGQGLAFAPLTSFGIVDVTSTDAGAASGLVNTAHQLGMALGLAALVAVSSGQATTTAQVARALGGGTVLLGLCLLVVVAVLVPAHRAASRS